MLHPRSFMCHAAVQMDNHNPERFARPGENPLIDETFKPTITKKKVEAVKTAAGGATSTGDRFLDGLAAREKAYRKTHPQRKKYEPKRPAAWGTTVSDVRSSRARQVGRGGAGRNTPQPPPPWYHSSIMALGTGGCNDTSFFACLSRVSAMTRHNTNHAPGACTSLDQGHKAKQAHTIE